MLGWINQLVKAFVSETYGADVWAKVLAKAGVQDNWVSTCPYSDSHTYSVVTAAAEILGVDPNVALEAFGAYFSHHVEHMGYANLLSVLGSNFAEFLGNLNDLHLHMSYVWPALAAPSFRVEQAGPESLLLHYYSRRPGLWPLVVGVLKTMAARYFGINSLGIELIAARHKGDCDHEIFKLTYPYQRVMQPDYGSAAARDSLYAMPEELFYRLHPFHFLLDEKCRVLQAGAALLRVCPSLRPGDDIVRHAKIHHPSGVPWDWEEIVEKAGMSFMVLMRESMVTLKGQMVPTTMPDPAGGAPRRVLLFLGSPRCSDLKEMGARQLYLSDIPLHDTTVDYLLLAEQRKTEADLKEKYERLAVELKAANEKLESTTQFLEEERRRAEALLYRMSNLLAIFPAGPERPAAAAAAAAAAAMQQQQQQQPQPHSGSLTANDSSGSFARSTVTAGAAAAVAAAEAALQSAAAGGAAGGAAAVLQTQPPASPPTPGPSAPAAAGPGSDRLVALAPSSGDLNPVGGSLVPGAGGSIAGRQSQTLERIEAVRRELSKANIKTGDKDDITCLELLGEGAYGKVYKGLWKGTIVAVKCVVLPANMSGQEKREKMAIMEAAISSALSHPNIMATYTYDIRSVCDSSAGGGPGSVSVSGDAPSSDSGAPGDPVSTQSLATMRLTGATAANVHSYEVRLVLEFCDRGSLRDALDQGAFSDSDGGGVNYAAVLDTALDVAAAMHHLHGRNVLHSDLKARNIMLKSAGSEGRGVVAKVADFGLAVKIGNDETHMSNTFQGTMTHMAPEIMMQGRISKAADVYAFGVLLWEIYSAKHAFKGVPRALLGHQVTQLQRRPEFPPGAPREYVELAERCWQAKAEYRPEMGEVLQLLKEMRAALSDPTPSLGSYTVSVITRNRPGPGGARGTGGGGGTGAQHRGSNSRAISGVQPQYHHPAGPSSTVGGLSQSLPRHPHFQESHIHSRGSTTSHPHAQAAAADAMLCPVRGGAMGGGSGGGGSGASGGHLQHPSQPRSGDLRPLAGSSDQLSSAAASACPHLQQQAQHAQHAEHGTEAESFYLEDTMSTEMDGSTMTGDSDAHHGALLAVRRAAGGYR